MKYIKKPVQIEALQWDGSEESLAEIQKAFPDLRIKKERRDSDKGYMCWYVVCTLEGPLILKEGDYVIKGIAGEFYPCKPEIFLKTYDAVPQA